MYGEVKMINIKINSIEEMRKFGIFLGGVLKGGDTISLNGNLGAGKTHLTKYIGEGMGISEHITSPTFAILNVYSGDTEMYHFDTYRLDGIGDFDELGFDDYLYSNGVSIVEWAEKISEYLPKDRLDIFIEKGLEEFERILIIKSKGDRSEEILGEIKNEYTGN